MINMKHNFNINYHVIKQNRSALDWPRRIQIGIDVASGLAYLHTAFETPFVHRDIKTANILLDSNFIAKVCINIISII